MVQTMSGDESHMEVLVNAWVALNVLCGGHLGDGNGRRGLTPWCLHRWEDSNSLQTFQIVQTGTTNDTQIDLAFKSSSNVARHLQYSPSSEPGKQHTRLSKLTTYFTYAKALQRVLIAKTITLLVDEQSVDKIFRSWWER